MDVRAATVDDIGEIQQVARQTWTVAYEDIVGPEEIERAMQEWYASSAIEQQLAADDVGYFVATDSGDVFGYASSGPSDAENCGELYSIYVHPDRWGDGVGARLLERATDHVVGLGFGRMRVAVLAENDVGNAFYRRCGFTLSEENEIELFTDETFEEFVYHRDVE